MSKKLGAVLVVIGIILLTISVIMLNGGKENKGEKNTKNTEVKYDYVKSRNINEKTKVSFPLYDNVVLNDNSISDFNVTYSNKEGLYINAYIYTTNDSLEDNETLQYNEYKSLIESQYKQIEKKDISCNYLCKNYKVYNDDKTVYRDELKVYINTSSNEIVELTYRLENAELSNDRVNNIIKDIKITHDAEYTIGTLSGDYLIIKLALKNNKFVSVKLDKNKYEESISEYNNIHRTEIKDKATGSIMTLVTQFRYTTGSLIKEIDKIHLNISESTKEELKIENKTIYKYIMGNSVGYAYLIDDDNALLIESETSSINIEDIIKNIEE